MILFWQELIVLSNTQVTIYYGPTSWFHEYLHEQEEYRYLTDIVTELDKINRQTSSFLGRVISENSIMNPKMVVAESTEFSGLQEHSIINFVSIIRSISPENLILHNPPKHLETQIKREFSVTEEHYKHPTITLSFIKEFNKVFTEYIIGQDAVKESLMSALYPLALGRCVKPIVLMFYGSSGVGKTETAKLINKLLGGQLFRKQFSMFQNEKFSSYLFGGDHSESSFARELLDRESGVILLDEFDKAHPVFHSGFYQLFDDGVFEDKNYEVKLGPSIIICTSNYNTEEEIQEKLGDALYSRFDFLIKFTPILKDEMKKVIDKIVDDSYIKLSDNEKNIIDPEYIKYSIYTKAVDKSSNIRKIGKLVDEVISLILVRSFLKDCASLEEKLPEVKNRK